MDYGPRFGGEGSWNKTIWKGQKLEISLKT